MQIKVRRLGLLIIFLKNYNKLYGYQSKCTMELNNSTVKFKVKGNDIFENNINFIIDFVSSFT
jgi:hypothetical protein